MGHTEIVVARHWRPEVADVADTLRAVLAADEVSEVRVRGGGRWPRPSTIGRTGDVALVSDVAPAPDASLVVRLWWNGADEVLAHRASGSGTPELAVCFFPDVADELRAAGIDVVLAPYAFATPTAAPTNGSDLVDRIGYTGEVDISEACFEPLTEADTGGRSPADLGSLAADLAAEVVTGASTMVTTDTDISTGHDLGPDAARTLLWSVRNRVRHDLLAAVAETFPDALRVRGDDWKRLGFAAEPTSFNRRLRTLDYRTHRVSLDLGSKSTHAALYPRSVEILAMAGGLVQFDSGEPLPPGTPGLADRRASSAADLLEVIAAVRDLPADELAAQNRALQQEYAAVRLESGRILLSAITDRAAAMVENRGPAAGRGGDEPPEPSQGALT